MTDAVTSLIVNKKGELLILKRSEKVRTYNGFWAGVSGYIEKDEEPYDTAIKEIREEVGLDKKDITFIKKHGPVEIRDIHREKKYNWRIFIFVFKTEKNDKINIDWEHSEYRWIAPTEIGKYETVPHLKEVVEKLLM